MSKDRRPNRARRIREMFGARETRRGPETMLGGVLDVPLGWFHQQKEGN